MEIVHVRCAGMDVGGVLDASGAAGGSGFRRGQSSDMEVTCADHVTNGAKNSWFQHHLERFSEGGPDGLVFVARAMSEELFGGS